jgi:hypothetical protein
MAPIRDAVSLVHNEQANAVGDGKEASINEFIVAEAFRRNQQEVNQVLLQSTFDGRPIRSVCGVDGFRSDTDISCGRDLVPHERQERRNKHSATGSALAEKVCREKVHQALPHPIR